MIIGGIVLLPLLVVLLIRLKWITLPTSLVLQQWRLGQALC